MNLITRRQALTAIAAAVAASSLLSCSKNDDTTSVTVNYDLETLAGVSYDLFPHEALSADLYVQVGQRLLSLNSPMVSQGLLQLQSAANNKAWMDIAEAQRLAALKAIENSEFFALLRSTTIDVLYHDATMFDLVGYGGSAIEKGGYLNRGFDDISWLPQKGSAQ